MLCGETKKPLLNRVYLGKIIMSDYAAFRSNFLYSQLPLSFMSNTEDQVEIWYFVVGKPQADSIRIALREHVSGLKKAIQSAAKLFDYGTPDIVIWKVCYSMAG